MQTPKTDEGSGREAEGGPTRSRTTPKRAGGTGTGKAALALAAGLAGLAALGAWLVGERTLDYYRPSEAAAKNLFDPTALRLELSVIVPRNTAIAFGVFGAMLGLAGGLAGGLSRRSPVAGVLAGSVGGLLGCAAGVGLSLAAVPSFLASFDPVQPSLMLPALVRGSIWMGIGAAAGLAFGLALGGAPRIVRATVGGLLGAFLGTFAFEILNALTNPLDRNDHPLPTAVVARLLGYLCVALLAATLAAAMATPGRGPAKRPEAEIA